MELKNYQKTVLNDLAAYLSEYGASGNAGTAFARFWESRPFNPGHRYIDQMKGAPNVCIKVPTGGGKTFIACNALRVIRDSMATALGRPVLWFVPSLSILDQTLHAFLDHSHPYRQKLNGLFSGKVAVLEKSEALAGAGFDPETVRRQLTIIVLSYDSFRSSTKEGRKVYQENSSLSAFPAHFGSGKPIENADDSSLARILNSMKPLIVVDESHNAKSTLSIEMLQNLDPSFILELTATPREQSNIISYVDPERLKTEQMVKLPVIVYNTRDVNEVVRTAIDLRRKLEHSAEVEHERGAGHIRPIALFQAEAKNAQTREEESATFGKIKEKLVGFGIPANQIAIKTAEINELKGIDLLSEQCPIRYIITINALKEGWDCPFAYILGSLANRSSAVDVEQVVGRILRQPYVSRSRQPFLNLSYVLTASDRFYETLQKVVEGLNRCGFSERDCRVKDEKATASSAEMPLGSQAPEQEDFIDVLDSTALPAGETAEGGSAPGGPAKSGIPVSAVIEEIEALAQEAIAPALPRAAGDAAEALSLAADAPDLKKMKLEFVNSAKRVILPSFYIKEDAGLFNDSEGIEKKLTREDLVKGFKLTNQDINLDFRPTELELYEVDIRVDARGFSRPEYTRLTEERSRGFAKLISHLSEADKKRELFAVLYGVMKRFDEIPEKDIRSYLRRVIESQEPARLDDMIQNPYQYAEILKYKVISLMTAHAIQSFQRRATENSLITKGSWKFPAVIQAPNSIKGLRRSLYEEEAEGNQFELEIANEIAGLDNVLFWHRNLERKGFCLNGYINHYPDFIAVTKRSNVLIVESKGDDRNNSDSAQKLKLGQAWEKKAGESFKYFMVFQSIHVEGAFAKNQLSAAAGRL